MNRYVICAATALALAGACDPVLPQPHARIVEALPTGTVRADELRIRFTASEPLDGASASGKAALCRADDLKDVKRLAEAGALANASVVASRVQLSNGGRTVELVPDAPLVPGGAYAALLAQGVRSADGRLVLDGEGKPRTVVVEFSVSPVLAGPVRAEVTKVLADAATPEAGGEYVEVANLASSALDLAGFTLAKRGPSGAFTRCSVERHTGISIEPGSRGLIVGGAYDGRYATPPAVPVYRCGASAVAGGLANDRAPALLLEDPSGAVVSSIGVAVAAPLCVSGALVRVEAAGPDAAANLACSGDLSPEAGAVVPGEDHP